MSLELLQNKLNANVYSVTGEQSWSSSLPYQILGGVLLTVMALVLFAAVSYHCAATWRWIRDRACRDFADTDISIMKQQAAIRISHSLPDLQCEPLKPEYVQEHKEAVKKVSIHFHN